MAWILNFILNVLPPSPNRLAGVKRWLLRRLAKGEVGENVRVMGVRVMGVRVSIGANTFIGHQTLIMGASDSEVNIGRDCDISSRVLIVTGTHVMSTTTLKCAGEGYGKDITIGDGVWIGAGATILPGIIIGKGAMIAAGAVVTKNVPEFEVWGGNPAKLIKRRDYEIS